MRAQNDSKELSAMIDWNTEDWGNRVHYCSHGSWVDDKHTTADASDARDE